MRRRDSKKSTRARPEPLPKPPATAAEVIALLIAAGALARIGLTTNHARTIRARDRIPAERDVAIVEVARELNLPIDFELLARLRAQPVVSEV